MKTYDPTQCLISIHIAKTGGGSLGAVLKQWFEERLFLHYPRGGTVRPPRVALMSGACIHGHFNASVGAGLDEYYPDAPQLMSFVREPFERFLSAWFFLNRQREAGAPTPTLEGARDFATFFENRARKGMSGTPAWCLSLLSADDPPRLNAMDRFVFLGIMERYQDSVDALAVALGKPRIAVPITGQTSRWDDFSSWRPKFEQAFPEEMRFYEAAKACNAELIQTFLP